MRREEGRWRGLLSSDARSFSCLQQEAMSSYTAAEEEANTVTGNKPVTIIQKKL
jgi:hypothetical protein